MLLRHGLPNAALPGLTVLALGIGGLLGGAAAVETVFTWPGMGLYIVDAIGARDLPVVQGFALVSAAIFILVNLGADLLGLVLDPRLRTRRGPERALHASSWTPDRQRGQRAPA